MWLDAISLSLSSFPSSRAVWHRPSMSPSKACICVYIYIAGAYNKKQPTGWTITHRNNLQQREETNSWWAGSGKWSLRKFSEKDQNKSSASWADKVSFGRIIKRKVKMVCNRDLNEAPWQRQPSGMGTTKKSLVKRVATYRQDVDMRGG